MVSPEQVGGGPELLVEVAEESFATEGASSRRRTEIRARIGGRGRTNTGRKSHFPGD
jgi:hypothetical protein